MKTLKYTQLLHILSIILIFGWRSNGQSTIDWKKDIEFLKEELPIIHADLFHVYSKSQYESDLNALQLKSPKLTNIEMYFEIQKIIAKIGDSHTSTDFLNMIPKIYLPFKVYFFEEGPFIRQTTESDEAMLGQKLVAINKIPIKTIIDSVKTLLAAENLSWERKILPNYLFNFSILEYFGFAKNKTLSISTEDYYGIPKSFNVKAFEWSDPDDIEFLKFSSKFTRRPRTKEIFGYKLLKNDSVLFVTYNKCTGREQQMMAQIRDSLSISESLNLCDNKTPIAIPKDKKKDVVLPYFRSFRDSIFKIIESKSIKKLVFDLSENTGGSTSQGSQMIEHLSKIIDKNRVKSYVIVSRNTFSAGLIHTMEAKRLLNAIIIGEPTGGKPSFYGGSDYNYLPSSCMKISFARSARKTTNDLELLQSETLNPDVKFPIRFSDIISGKDLEYEWIMAN